MVTPIEREHDPGAPPIVHSDHYDHRNDNYTAMTINYGKLEVESKATEYRIWVEDKIGEILCKMEKNPGTRTLGGGIGAGGKISEPPANIQTLKELGITKAESKTYQDFHSLSDEKKTLELLARGLTTRPPLNVIYYYWRNLRIQ
jgi:ABC-type molybdenum transport system ATPase subunit/photorepair protein PhrA